MHKNLTRS